MNQSQTHSGVAAVEAAFCLPLLVFIFFGSLEISGGIFQQYNAQAAAFELSKVALTRQKTCADVQSMATQILPQQAFTTYSISIAVEPRTANGDSVQAPAVSLFSIPQSGATTPGLEVLPRGTLLRLTLTVERPPIAGMGLTRSFLDQQIVSDCVFVKEF